MRLPMDQASSLRSDAKTSRHSGVQEESSGSDSAAVHFAEPERRNARAPEDPDTRKPERLLPPLLAIVSGKGGVGKTFLAIHLALAFRSLGRHPLLLDLDWGLANIDVALGLAPPYHVGHVLAGDCSLDAALIEHEGLVILPNGCGQAELAVLDGERRQALIDAVRRARPDRDFIIADTHPGIGPIPVDVAASATATVIVSTPEPTALTDTYALVKVLGERGTRSPVGLVLNQVRTPAHAAETTQHLDSVARRFLGHGITCWGHVLQDPAVSRSVCRQRPLFDVAPRSAAALCVRTVAATLAVALADGESSLGAVPGASPAGARR